MRDPDTQLANACGQSTATPPLPLKRRSLLARAAMAPVATSAVGLLGTPAEAEALTLTPPDTVDCYDVGDSLLRLGARRCRW